MIEAASAEAPALAAEVAAGLGARPRALPCRLLYDSVGSALFEAITLLPEYGLARADRKLLRRHAAAIGAALPQPSAVVELGAGSARKTRPVLAAIPGGFAYTAVDISPEAVRICRRALVETPGMAAWRGVVAEFLPGLEQAAERTPGQRLTVFFLGGTIGNLSREAATGLLRGIHARLAPGDALLLGTDLEQNPARLLPAYDDAAGVTAAFNRNLLVRLRRELGAQLDPAGFAHEARWNAAERRVEMHLRAVGEQTIAIPEAGFACRLADGESIWTESSYKYTKQETRHLGAAAGFEFVAQWQGAEWPAAETLFARN